MSDRLLIQLVRMWCIGLSIHPDSVDGTVIPALKRRDAESAFQALLQSAKPLDERPILADLRRDDIHLEFNYMVLGVQVEVIDPKLFEDGAK